MYENWSGCSSKEQRPGLQACKEQEGDRKAKLGLQKPRQSFEEPEFLGYPGDLSPKFFS